MLSILLVYMYVFRIPSAVLYIERYSLVILHLINMVTLVTEAHILLIADTSNEVLVNMDGAGEDHDMITIRLRLKELIQIVLNCLDHYQGMHSTDIKNAATSLISSFQS